MCGRYEVDADSDELLDFFDMEPSDIAWTRNLDLRPTDPVPLLRLTANGRRELAVARWMLVPPWAKSPKDFRATFNARCETAATLPTFREAYKKRRCLLPCTGFFEWQTIPGQRRKLKHRLAPSRGRFLCFAGLYERYQDSHGVLESCTILTTTPNTLVSPIHNRMPVILEPQAYDAWLDPRTELELVAALLQPCPDAVLEVHPAIH